MFTGLVQSTWHAENNINNATVPMASSQSATEPHPGVCHQLSVPQHLTCPSLPICTDHPNLHFLFYKSYRCAWQAHVCTPCFCVMSNLKLIWAHWKPLVGFYGFCITDSASGQSHFSQEAACAFHIQFISTHSWMKWLSKCKTVNWFDYWFSCATYSKNCPVPLDQVC